MKEKTMFLRRILLAALGAANLLTALPQQQGNDRTAADSTGIRFESSTFDEALAKAGRENKLLFMDCYTAWCGPCKMLSRTVFTNDTVGDFFNRHFVNLKMDMEKGEGKTLAQTYRIKAYPTLLFIHPQDRSVVYRLTGARPDIRWLMEHAENAVDPHKNLRGLSALYARHPQSSDIAFRYLACLSAASLTQERDSVLGEYLSRLPADSCCTPANWRMLEAYAVQPYSSAFSFLLSHISGFRQTVGKEAVERKLEEVYRPAVMQFITRKRLPEEQFPQERFRRLVSLIQASDSPQAPYYGALLTLVEQVQKGDYNAMLDALDRADSAGVLATPDMRFYFVWLNLTYLSECRDATAITRGLEWLERLKPYFTAPGMEKSRQSMENKLRQARATALQQSPRTPCPETPLP